MSHRMSTPCGIIDINKTKTLIESLSFRITFIDKQTDCWYSKFCPTLNSSLKQLRSNALSTEITGDGETVNIELTIFRLICHACIINSKSFQCCFIESTTELMQFCTIISDTDTSQYTTGGIGSQDITITILAIFHLDQTGHHTMKVNQCMLRSSKVLTTLSIHRLHDKRCNMRSHVRRSIFYFYLHNACKDKQNNQDKRILSWLFFKDIVKNKKTVLLACNNLYFKTSTLLLSSQAPVL